MKKRTWIALALACTLMLGLLSGCASNDSGNGSDGKGQQSSDPVNSSQGSDQTESQLIGSNMFGTGAYAFDMYEHWIRTAVEGCGDTYTFLDDSYNPDNTLDNIKSLVASEVDGVVGFLFTDAAFASCAEFLEENKVPFSSTEEPSVEDLREEIRNYEYFLGSNVIDHVSAGTEMAEIALANGGKTAMIISQYVGNVAGETRAAAFTEVFEAGGGTVVGIVNASDASDAVPKAENMLLANPGVDVILGTGCDFAGAGVTVLQNHPEVSAKVYAIEIDENIINCLRDETIAAASGDSFMYSYFSAILLQHYLKTGEKVTDTDGKCIFFHINPGILKPEMLDIYTKVFLSGTCPYTDEEVNWMVNDAAPDELKAAIEDFGIEARIRAQYEAGNITEAEMKAAGLM